MIKLIDYIEGAAVILLDDAWLLRRNRWASKGLKVDSRVSCHRRRPSQLHERVSFYFSLFFQRVPAIRD